MPLPDGPHGMPLVIGVGGAAGRITRNRTRIVAAMRKAIDTYRAEVELEVAAAADGKSQT